MHYDQRKRFPNHGKQRFESENPQVTGKIQHKTACIISWIAVIAMLALIFFMSSRSGIDIDNNTGIFSAVKQ